MDLDTLTTCFDEVRHRVVVPASRWIAAGVIPECPTTTSIGCPTVPDPVPDDPAAIPPHRAAQFVWWWNSYRAHYGLSQRLWRGKLVGSDLHAHAVIGVAALAQRRIAPPHWIAFIHGMDGVSRWSIETACRPNNIAKYRHYCRDHYKTTGSGRVVVGPIAASLIHRYRTLLLQVTALRNPDEALVRRLFSTTFPGDEFEAELELAQAEAARERRRIRGALASTAGIWIWPFDALGKRSKAAAEKIATRESEEHG